MNLPLLDGAALVALTALLIVASAVDLRQRIIPNGVVIGLAAVWAAWQAGRLLLGVGWQPVIDGLVGAAIIGGGLLVFTLLYERITRKQAMGGGDIKLMAACALYLGLERGALCLLIACALGVLLAAIIPHTRFARADERAAMPFGPAIALATLGCLLIP
ncbi:prepilin peptidase [Adlercreutzia murintestinalis]|uniref:prepilin peptidase n=1 Tax=Adlercreutzia murintestinalis TaxID=2941325 RepID=UPI00203C8FC8|nr:A24 family peptidase [Adlercreutzia murintestinalis]